MLLGIAIGTYHLIRRKNENLDDVNSVFGHDVNIFISVAISLSAIGDVQKGVKNEK